jgi:hypothetical protein
MEGLLQAGKLAAGVEDQLKDRRWQACYRDGRLTEGQKTEGLLQG